MTRRSWWSTACRPGRSSKNTKTIFLAFCYNIVNIAGAERSGENGLQGGQLQLHDHRVRQARHQGLHLDNAQSQGGVGGQLEVGERGQITLIIESHKSWRVINIDEPSNQLAAVIPVSPLRVANNHCKCVLD